MSIHNTVLWKNNHFLDAYLNWSYDCYCSQFIIGLLHCKQIEMGEGEDFQKSCYQGPGVQN